MVLPVRIELTTSPLPRGCSTTELRQLGASRAGIHLGPGAWQGKPRGRLADHAARSRRPPVPLELSTDCACSCIGFRLAASVIDGDAARRDEKTTDPLPATPQRMRVPIIQGPFAVFSETLRGAVNGMSRFDD